MLAQRLEQRRICLQILNIYRAVSIDSARKIDAFDNLAIQIKIRIRSQIRPLYRKGETFCILKKAPEKLFVRFALGATHLRPADRL